MVSGSFSVPFHRSHDSPFIAVLNRGLMVSGSFSVPFHYCRD
jgi:hypothetical protein